MKTNRRHHVVILFYDSPFLWRLQALLILLSQLVTIQFVLAESEGC